LVERRAVERFLVLRFLVDLRATFGLVDLRAVFFFLVLVRFLVDLRATLRLVLLRFFVDLRAVFRLVFVDLRATFRFFVLRRAFVDFRAVFRLVDFLLIAISIGSYQYKLGYLGFSTATSRRHPIRRSNQSVQSIEQSKRVNPRCNRVISSPSAEFIVALENCVKRKSLTDKPLTRNAHP